MPPWCGLVFLYANSGTFIVYVWYYTIDWILLFLGYMYYSSQSSLVPRPLPTRGGAWG